MQRIIGAVLGALVTYVLLVILVGGVSTQTFLIAVGIGLIVTIVWPWVIELMVARRATARRKAASEREAQDQLLQKSDGG
jgi:branched-subunit amino acid ABC-type transport system permease component